MLANADSSSPHEPLLRLEGVCKQYTSGPTTVKALRPTSITLERGEFVLLEGPSGSGKTTLLTIMGLLMKSDAGGRISVCGEDCTKLGEDRLPSIRLRHIGFIFQTFNLFPALSALDNVKLVLKLKGRSWGERRKEAPMLLDRVGLAACMNRKPADLSGGQRQRVCIARALAGDSDIILADEPTAALDTVTGLSIIELLREEARTRGKGVLVVTHDPRLEKYATRIDRIADGILVGGTPKARRGAAVHPSDDGEIFAAHARRELAAI